MDSYMAWGSGSDFARAAMAMGAKAEQAVRVASRFSIDCGLGVDALTPEDVAEPTVGANEA